jgi:hypothetical protein
MRDTSEKMITKEDKGSRSHMPSSKLLMEDDREGIMWD